MEAAEKYDIPDLGEAVRQIILARGSSWFGVDVVVSLYMFAKKLCPDEEGEGTNNEEPMDEDAQVQSDSDDSGDDGEGGGDEEEIENSWEAVKVKALKVLKW